MKVASSGPSRSKGTAAGFMVLRDLNDIARALHESFEHARELVESTILKHTAADVAGIRLFAARSV